MSKAVDTKALARVAAADIKQAGDNEDAVAKAIVQAMSGAVQAERAKGGHHTLTDGAVNALVAVGETAAGRGLQNVVGDLFGKRGRAILNRVYGALGLVTVLATKGGTRANQAGDKALTLATIDGTDAVYSGLRQAFVGEPGQTGEGEVMVGEVVATPPH